MSGRLGILLALPMRSFVAALSTSPTGARTSPYCRRLEHGSSRSGPSQRRCDDGEQSGSMSAAFSRRGRA
jgi:hypothetical protein